MQRAYLGFLILDLGFRAYLGFLFVVEYQKLKSTFYVSLGLFLCDSICVPLLIFVQ